MQKEQKEQCKVGLPSKEESLTERIARFQDSMNSEHKSQQESDYEFTCQSSKSSKDLFTKTDMALVRRGFSAILQRASVTDKEINSALASNEAAKSIASKFKRETIRNRLKYEIRKARREKKHS